MSNPKESLKTIRKKRAHLDIKTKIKIIHQKLINARTIDQLAVEFGVERSTISKIVKDKEKILAKSEMDDRCRIQPGQFDLVDKALLTWATSARAKGLPISVRILQEKATFFYNQFKSRNAHLPDKFEASQGWFCKWQQRTGFYVKTENGESKSVDMNLVEEGRRELKDILQDYDIEDIYNADELGLFTCLGPNKTLASKDDKAKGMKKIKTRVTVLLATNASGKVKVKPLVINKTKTLGV